MSEFELYNAPQSICSHKVRFALHAKGQDFVEHKLDLFSGDQLKPEYLAINPNGLVPTLMHRTHAAKRPHTLPWLIIQVCSCVSNL